jgi:hypothetical protein
MARVKRRVLTQTGQNKHSSKNAATKNWRGKDRLQAKFDRLAGPVTITYKEPRK